MFFGKIHGFRGGFQGRFLSYGVSVTLSSSLAAAALLVSLCSAPAAFAAPDQVLSLAMTGEPPNLDTTKATDAESFFVLGHTMEGLTRYDKSGKIVPGVAESWTINEKTATFKLRKNAKWSDGSPITAKDFIFAWKTALDPKTASEYSFILYPIKNAEAINTKKAPLNDLGVIAKDDHTLEVTFEKPCGYFISLTSFATYMPIKEEFYKAQNGRYAADAANLLYNGPFVLTKWIHGASLQMDKNPNYWNAAAIKLTKIDVPFITPDDSARFNLFKTAKIDILNLSKDNLQNAQRENFGLSKFSDGTLFFMRFNMRDGRVTANKKLRKAISLAINFNDYISKVIGIPGTLRGTGLVPTYMMGVNKTFRAEHPITPPKQNLAEAKKLIEEAKAELKVKGPLTLVWLTGDSSTTTKEAEYFQSVFKRDLGIDLKIDKQIFKQRLAKSSAGEFDIEAAGWGPDYGDPMTFVDLFTTWNNNNNGKYASKEYDALVRKAMVTANQPELWMPWRPPRRFCSRISRSFQPSNARSCTRTPIAWKASFGARSVSILILRALKLRSNS
jgi:oligopeptide transport system substrate-binding protein